VDGFFDTTAFDTAADLIDAIQVPIFVLDVGADGTITFAKLNREYERVTNIRSRDFAGKRPEEILPARMAETVLANYRRCIEMTTRHVYEEVLLLDNEERWWETTLSPVIEEGRVVRIYGVASEITDRKAEEFRRTEAFSDLKKLNDELNVFSAMVAHDMRGPLRRIRVMTDMLVEDISESNPEHLELVESCRGMTDRALGYVNDILGYTRSIRAEPAAPETVDIGHILSDATALLDPDKKFDIRYPDLHVTTDKVAMQLILHNLIDNAIKHAKHRIRVSVESDPDQARNIVLTVADDGEGFDEGEQTIGEPLEVAKTGSVSGFGLAAIRHLAETRNGLAWSDEPSFPEGGATIRVSLRGEMQD